MQFLKYCAIINLAAWEEAQKAGDADVAQQVERILGKDEVTGSNPVISSKNHHDMYHGGFIFL